ncbi:Hypothetical predicted protein [Pelobates cultripes]|uniref:Uncharacterized protein n=1 Tax=Pelobates cultripes TaxID=61616 RepID=A0AAD1VKS2_PELCU|nr:Hypothetical predicted protein [Pelobates cultripes]
MALRVCHSLLDPPTKNPQTTLLLHLPLSTLAPVRRELPQVSPNSSHTHVAGVLHLQSLVFRRIVQTDPTGLSESGTIRSRTSPQTRRARPPPLKRSGGPWAPRRQPSLRAPLQHAAVLHCGYVSVVCPPGKRMNLCVALKEERGEEPPPCVEVPSSLAASQSKTPSKEPGIIPPTGGGMGPTTIHSTRAHIAAPHGSAEAPPRQLAAGFGAMCPGRPKSVTALSFRCTQHWCRYH